MPRVTKKSLAEFRYQALCKLLENTLTTMQEMRSRELEMEEQMDHLKILVELQSTIIKARVISPQTYSEMLKICMGVEGPLQ
jgi:hypothetical protein